MEDIEYELIDISYELLYDLNDGKDGRVVADGSNDEQTNINEIEYDENGIPKGQSMEEIKIRQKLIFEFYEHWKEEHPEKSVFNSDLKADILIRKESVVEAAEHSSKKYGSTIAVMRLDELLAGAVQVGKDKAKPGNKNQEKLQNMLLMEYNMEGVGRVKLTVGERRRTLDKIQYGIYALPKEADKIEPATEKKKKAPQK